MAADLRKQRRPALTSRTSHGYTSPPMAGSGRDGAWAGMGTGWAVTSTLVAGIAVWGGIGYLVDRLVGSDRVFVAFGIVLGAAGGIYIVYQRYGKRGRDGGSA